MLWHNIKELAKQLADAYGKARPVEVEDDVSLCVWVRRECGVDLTLRQAGQLRDLLDEEAS